MPADPDILVDLTTARNAFEAEMIAEALRSRGVPAEAFTTAGSMLQWDIAATQPMRVQVRRRDLGRAVSELLAIRAEVAAIDWSTVDTGSMPPPAPGDHPGCPECGYDVSGLRGSGVCPECGRPLSEDVPALQGARRSRPGARMFWVGIVAVGLLALLRALGPLNTCSL